VVILVFIAIPPKIHKNTTFSHRHGISGRNCLEIEVYLWVFACIYFHNSGIFWYFLVSLVSLVLCGRPHNTTRYQNYGIMWYFWYHWYCWYCAVDRTIPLNTTTMVSCGISGIAGIAGIALNTTTMVSCGISGIAGIAGIVRSTAQYHLIPQLWYRVVFRVSPVSLVLCGRPHNTT
jgi:hypothetical protein